jgi:hypothetical protein
MYPITKEAKQRELNIIKDTLHNTEYNTNLGMRHFNQHKQKKSLIHNTRKPNGPLSHTVVKKQRKLQNSLNRHK